MELTGSHDLVKSLLTFESARDIERRKEYVDEHPELLSEEVDRLLHQNIMDAERRGDRRAEFRYQDLRRLFAQCRCQGVQALDDFYPRADLECKFIAFSNGLRTFQERKAFLQQHPELLSDKAVDVIELLIYEWRQKEMIGALCNLRHYRSLLHACRRLPLDEAFSDHEDPSNETLNEVLAALRTGEVNQIFFLRRDVKRVLNNLKARYGDDSSEMNAFGELMAIHREE